MNIRLLSVNNHVPHSLHVSSACRRSIPAITTLTHIGSPSEHIRPDRTYIWTEFLAGLEAESSSESE